MFIRQKLALTDTGGDSVYIESSRNLHGYHSILQPHVVLSGLCLVRPSFVLQQDSDPKVIRAKCPQRSVMEFTRDPQSPIEKVWDELSWRVKLNE